MPVPSSKAPHLLAWLFAWLLAVAGLVPGTAVAAARPEHAVAPAESLRGHAVPFNFEYFRPDVIAPEAAAVPGLLFVPPVCTPLPLSWAAAWPVAWLLSPLARPQPAIGRYRERLLRVSLSPNAP
ncbi:hypothetical protein GCM10023185_08340 [Hymenobacter saemangeumensis]|uniref:Uncharacterized protein n=1 Tax=Hymenobacter saemangeumensis TaxID=1084522 RepID=A0ABP8I3F0_9BACT